MARLMLAVLLVVVTCCAVSVSGKMMSLAEATQRTLKTPPHPFKPLSVNPSKFAVLGTEEARAARAGKDLCGYSDFVNGEVVFDLPALLSRYGLEPDMCVGVIDEPVTNEKDVVCPKTVADPTNLPAGSCCSHDSQCDSGLFCDEFNRICTKHCRDENDCAVLGNFDSTYCVLSTYYTGEPDTCAPCMLYSDCQGVGMCTLCDQYVGPVDDSIMTAANCDASSGDFYGDSYYYYWSDYSYWNVTDYYDYNYQPDWEWICYEVECIIAYYSIIADIFKECYADVCIDDYLDWLAEYYEMYYVCKKWEGRFCGEVMLNSWYGEYDTPCDQADAAGCCLESLVDTMRFLNETEYADFFEQYYAQCDLEPACPHVNIWDHGTSNESSDDVAIALGVLACVAVVGAGAFFVWKKKRGTPQDRDTAVANNPQYVTMSNPDGEAASQWSQPLNVN